MENVEADWKELEGELAKFQKNHQEYVKKLEEVEQMKKTYLEKFNKFNKKLRQLNSSISHVEKTQKQQQQQQQEQELAAPTAGERLDAVKGKVKENLNFLHQISHTFPRPNSLYLKVIIGSVCVSILNKEEKWKYKEEYEKFKYAVTCISMLSAFILIFIKSYRSLDAVFNFLLVWYYCTLTIRESILVVNGSRIKSWWLAHHFISTVCTGILLIWPNTEAYSSFRQQFIWFSFYLSNVQVLQYYYQKGCLYRLRALGESAEMETTVEGFQSWMSRGLSFLLPFLFFGYFWQLYNSYVLFKLAMSDTCHDWHVPALSLIFFVLFAGNFYTSYMVIRNKFREGISSNFQRLKYKYNDWNKSSTKTPTEKAQ